MNGDVEKELCDDAMRYQPSTSVKVHDHYEYMRNCFTLHFHPSPPPRCRCSSSSSSKRTVSAGLAIHAVVQAKRA